MRNIAMSEEDNYRIWQLQHDVIKCTNLSFEEWKGKVQIMPGHPDSPGPLGEDGSKYLEETNIHNNSKFQVMTISIISLVLALIAMAIAIVAFVKFSKLEGIPGPQGY